MLEFMRWGDASAWKWSFGWWTGPDGDLMCVIPKAKTSKQAENALSPVCSSRLLAIFYFVLKRLKLKWNTHTFMIRWYINRIIAMSRPPDVEYEKHLKKERREFAEILGESG